MSPAFVDEVLRINARYLDELVDAFAICPYAMPSRAGGRVARRVLPDAPSPTTAAALDAIASLEADPQIEIGLVIYPRAELDAPGFDAFVAGVRAADQARRPPETRAPFALAPFHPEAEYRPDAPARLVTFFRRAPDPTIQLVRFSALDAVKGARPSGKFLFDFSAEGLAELEKRAATRSVSERIADDNFARAQGGGLAKMQAVLDDIRADRARSYARFGPGGRSLQEQPTRGTR